MHPFFCQSDDFEQAMKDLRANIEQIYKYVRTYCDETESAWCKSELAAFEADLV